MYNGWKNYVTWNIALWINNDEALYLAAKPHKDYYKYIENLRELGITETKDRVSLNDSGIDHRRLSQLIADIT